MAYSWPEAISELRFEAPLALRTTPARPNSAQCYKLKRVEALQAGQISGLGMNWNQ